MGFTKYIPCADDVDCQDLYTTCSAEVQLWQELVMLRHLPVGSGIYAQKVSSPWIDQAKTYFLDGWHSDWRGGKYDCGK